MERAKIACAAAAAALALAGCDRGDARASFDDDVEACVARLRTLHAGLVEHTRRHGAPPTGSGVAFFGALIAKGTWPADEEHVALLSCPGVDARELAGSDLAPRERWSDLARADEGWSAYAGRDQERAPLAQLPGPGSEVLLACDNHRAPNHARGVTNALFADGSVVTFELALEIAEGRVPAGSTHIAVGPDSPIAALRVLRADAR